MARNVRYGTLNKADLDLIRRVMKEVAREETLFLAGLIDDRYKRMRSDLRSTVETLEEGIAEMDNLVQRAREVADRQATVVDSWKAFWAEVKPRLDQAVQAGDIEAIRQQLDRIDQNSTEIGQAFANNTAAAGETPQT